MSATKTHSPSPQAYQVNVYRQLMPLMAGGVGAAAGQCVTCPVDVVQTRLQSTCLNFNKLTTAGNTVSVYYHNRHLRLVRYFTKLLSYMKYMVKTEGLKSLFKGLTPGLFGIVPAKAIYFYCYANSKTFLKKHTARNSYVNHSLSALLAGSVTATLTNPIWYVKTQLQLNQSSRSVVDIIRHGMAVHGSKSFFRGLTASYVGVSEAVLYFLMYEELKIKLNLNSRRNLGEGFQPSQLMLAALTSKIAATSVTYPHEVVRTRLRQDEIDEKGRLKYRHFIQTAQTVAKEEGWVSLYGGFGTSMVRQLPNTAAVFLTYEIIMYMAATE